MRVSCDERLTFNSETFGPQAGSQGLAGELCGWALAWSVAPSTGRLQLRPE